MMSQKEQKEKPIMDLAHRASEVAKKHYPDPEVTALSDYIYET